MSSSAPTAKLADVADLNPPLAASLSDGDDVSFIPMAAVDADSMTAVDLETRLYSEVSKGYTPFLDGDVLVAKITPCFENGKIAQVCLSRRYGFGSTEFHIVRPRSDRADARYLVHFLRQDSVRKQGESRMTGSAGQRRVPEHFLAGLTIPLPPLPEQRRIAEILDKADALRAKRRAALAKLDTLTQSIFLDMFGDPATNPKGWNLTPLGEISEVQGGLQLSSSRKSLPREVPYLRVANVYRGFLDLGEIKTLCATESEIARTVLFKDDFLVVEGHGNPEEIGRGALWDGSISECVHQNHLIRVRFDNRRIMPLYASVYLNSTGGRRHLLRSGKTTSGLNTINVSQVRATPTAVPPVDFQRQFCRQVGIVEHLRTSHRAALVKLDSLLGSLLHRAFQGEL